MEFEKKTYLTKMKVPCRLSYARVNKPVTGRNGQDRYSATCLIDKNDTATVEKIQAAIDEAVRKGIDLKWDGSCPDMTTHILRDGDTDRADDEAYRGHWYFTASNTDRPILVDKKVRILEENEREMVYSGCYCNVMVDFYPYKSATGSGIAAELGNIQFVKAGEPLGIRCAVDKEFDVLD